MKNLTFNSEVKFANL